MSTEDVIATPFGLFLVTQGELIGETTRAGTLWDGPGFLQPIAREYGRLGDPMTTILDVGANQGAFSIWLASRGAWRVIAVEPVPIVMQRLKANLDLNKAVTADTVIPLEVAGYDRRAVLDLPHQLDPGNWGGTALGHGDDHTLTVPGYPLDEYWYLFGDRVSLIKVDAQGCDGAVLMGLERTITRDHPAIVYEWDATLAAPHGYGAYDTLRWLNGLGYSVHEWPTHPNNYLAVWRGDRA